MEKGVCKTWTAEQEKVWARRLKGCLTFAEQHLTMTLRDLLKYDGRSKEGKRAIAQGRLRLATATDEDLEELAKLESQMKEGGGPDSVADILKTYKELRAKIRGKGIKRSDLDA